MKSYHKKVYLITLVNKINKKRKGLLNKITWTYFKSNQRRTERMMILNVKWPINGLDIIILVKKQNCRKNGFQNAKLVIQNILKDSSVFLNL